MKLPKRCYYKHGAFWYVHSETNRWEGLGTDIALAREKAMHYNDPSGVYGSVAWYLKEFLIHFEALVKLGEKAPRTLEDYRGYSEKLVVYFGNMNPAEVKPHHISRYLDLGKKAERGVQANREKACLSSMFSWMRLQGFAGITSNPCKETGRNRERARTRYVTNEEYRRILYQLTPGAKLALELAYATLQRPEDILSLTRDDITLHNGEVVLKVVQNKNATRDKQTTVLITIDKHLKAILDQCEKRGHLIISRLEERYTTDGIGSMIRKHCKKAGIQNFGIQDIKAKGATDMFKRGVPVEIIKQLCGHKKISTTEIYIKRHMPTISVANAGHGPYEKKTESDQNAV